MLQTGCGMEQSMSMMQSEDVALCCAISKDALHDWPQA